MDDQFKQLLPVGRIEQLSDEKLAEVKLPPHIQLRMPSRMPRFDIQHSGIPVDFDKAIQAYLDEKFGPAYPVKWHGEPTGEWKRPGEGKFLRNLVDAHNHIMKNMGIQETDHDPAKIYVYGFAHHKQFEALATIQVVGIGVNQFTIGMAVNGGLIIMDKLTRLRRAMETHLVEARPFILRTDWNVVQPEQEEEEHA